MRAWHTMNGAWTKRVANRHVVQQLNATLDAGAAYEMVSFLQLERAGWKEQKDFGSLEFSSAGLEAKAAADPIEQRADGNE